MSQEEKSSSKRKRSLEEKSSENPAESKTSRLLIKIDKDDGRMYITPEKLPPTPDAPIKDEVLPQESPSTRFVRVEGTKRAIDFGGEEDVREDDAQDEESQGPNELDRIDVFTFDVDNTYNEDEPNFMIRAATAIIDGLIVDEARHKQWYLERALMALIGNGTIEDLKQRFEEETEQGWDDGVPL